MKQPDNEQEKALLDINSETKSLVHIPYTNKSYRVGYMKPYCSEKITKLIVESEASVPKSEVDSMKLMSERSKLLSKASAYIILNNFFKINLFYPFLWRYFYFIKEYTYDQLFFILVEAKKKIQLEGFSLSMAFLHLMKETKMTMTTKEAKAYHQELLSAQEQASAKNTPGQ